MSDSSAEAPDRPGRPVVPTWLRGGLGLIVVALGAMWVVEIVDTIALDDRLEGNGIRPRRVDGIDGIAWAPFLHGGFPHLISNTIPFAILSGLTMARGTRRYVGASAIIIAGKPLSQVATPITPFRWGRERTNRRNTIAASFR